MRLSVTLGTLALAAAAVAGVAAPASAQTFTPPGSADQARDATPGSGAPTRPIVWGAKNAFELRFDALHATGEPAVQVDGTLVARHRDARDRSLALARSGMMQRYAAAQEAQRSAIGAGTPSQDGSSAR